MGYYSERDASPITAARRVASAKRSRDLINERREATESQQPKRGGGAYMDSSKLPAGYQTRSEKREVLDSSSQKGIQGNGGMFMDSSKIPIGGYNSGSHKQEPNEQASKQPHQQSSEQPQNVADDLFSDIMTEVDENWDDIDEEELLKFLNELEGGDIAETTIDAGIPEEVAPADTQPDDPESEEEELAVFMDWMPPMSNGDQDPPLQSDNGKDLEVEMFW